MFSHSFLINSLPYNERFCKKGDCNIFMPLELSKRYTLIMKNAIDRRKNNKDFKICCKSLRTHFICIDQFGKVYPCFLHRFYTNDLFNHNDYSTILEYKYDFCYECEEYTKKLLEMNGMEIMA